MSDTLKPGYEKAAILLVALESQAPEITGPILAEMGQEKAKDMFRAISNLGKVSEERIQEVLSEFFEMAVEKRFIFGGKDVSAKLLEQSFGLSSEDALFAQEVRFFDFLDDIPDEDLLSFLASENLQARGLILNAMPGARVAALFAQMDRNVAKALSQIMLKFDVPNNSLIWAYHNRLKSLFLDEDEVGSSEMKYLKKLARVLESLPDESREEILMEMKMNHPESAAKLQKLIFTFADLVEIPDADLETILYEVEQVKTLAIALSEADDELITKVDDNISERIKLILDDEKENLPELEDEEIQAAQTEVMLVARNLEKEGKIKTLTVPED